MNLDKITPLILTYNEAPNIGRMLGRLAWAHRIVVVDSFSTDETLSILKRYPAVQVFQRPFDHFAEQCNFGLQQISSEWVISLDADYVLSQTLIEELKGIPEATSCSGYRASFEYCINGHPLRSTLLPARVVLYRRSQAVYCRDGHAHRVAIPGETGSLKNVIFHDDRKSFRRWFRDQKRYAALEAKKLWGARFGELNFQDRIRRLVLFAPGLVVLYCLFVKGLILDGWRGWVYTFQRFLAEALLSLRLLKR
jgi:glycosyltransferase involved in cell wall biosynthesis